MTCRAASEQTGGAITRSFFFRGRSRLGSRPGREDPLWGNPALPARPPPHSAGSSSPPINQNDKWFAHFVPFSPFARSRLYTLVNEGLPTWHAFSSGKADAFYPTGRPEGENELSLPPRPHPPSLRRTRPHTKRSVSGEETTEADHIIVSPPSVSQCGTRL